MTDYSYVNANGLERVIRVERASHSVYVGKYDGEQKREEGWDVSRIGNIERCTDGTVLGQGWHLSTYTNQNAAEAVARVLAALGHLDTK